MTARVTYDHESGVVSFKCPGCSRTHRLNTKPMSGRPVWSFNGDVENPTLAPLINDWWEFGAGKTYRCHSFVQDGRIRFLNDCNHELAGQIVDLPIINSEEMQ